MTKQYIGAQIKKIRTQKRLTQEELAKLAGIPVQRLPDIENGISNMTLKRLFQLCAALEVVIDFVPDYIMPEAKTDYSDL
jgi:transcriptional regulator with XRE-family HTH domain